MGQRLSKSVATRLQSASRQNEKAVLKEAADEAAKRRAAAARGEYGGFTDPNASIAGFRRERGEIWDVEKKQEEFLRQQQNRGASESKDMEMSEDLLKFLNDAGPLERRVDKEFTSPKVYEALTNEEEERRLRERESSLRRRRRMPLAERLGEGLGGDSPDGAQSARSEEERMALSVDRTTNFSTAEEEEDPTVVRLRDVDLLGLLRTETSSATTSAGAGELPSAGEAAEAYLRDIEATFPEGVVSATGVREDNLSLISNALRYGRVPVLMKEIETGEFIGVWGHKVEELKKLELRTVGDGEVKLGLDEIKRQEEEGEAMDQPVLAETEEELKQSNTIATPAGYSLGDELTSEQERKVDTTNEGEVLRPSSPELKNKRNLLKGSTATSTAAFLEEERRRLQEQSEGGR